MRSLDPIEKPSKSLANSVDQDHVVRDLAHGVDLEAVLASPQAEFGHSLEDPLGLRDPAHEGQHEHDVGEPHLLAHASHGRHSSAKPSA